MMGGDEDLARESLPVGPDELRFNGTRDIRGEEKMGVLVGETQHEGAVVFRGKSPFLGRWWGMKDSDGKSRPLFNQCGGRDNADGNLSLAGKIEKLGGSFCHRRVFGNPQLPNGKVVKEIR